jgi:hypothetical protein
LGQWLGEGATENPFFSWWPATPHNQRFQEPERVFGGVDFANSDDRARFELVRGQKLKSATGNVRHTGGPAQFIFALSLLAKDHDLNVDPIPGTPFDFGGMIQDRGVRPTEHGRLPRKRGLSKCQPRQLVADQGFHFFLG